MLKIKPINIINNEILNYIENEEDDYVENYEEISLTYNPNISLETQAILNCCELLVDNYKSPEERKLLDVGAGAGFVIQSLHANEKIAVDISKNQLLRIDEGIKKIRANVEELPFEDNYFNILICSDVFEHVKDEKKLVEEIKRVLKPDGLFLFACPWKQDLSVYDLPEYKEKFKQYKYVHLRSIDEKVIEENFSKDFEQISSTMITVAMKQMIFKPYPIKFFQFIKK